MGLTFHRLIRKDLRSVLAYYEEAVGPELARRFYQEFEELVAAIERNPRRFHLVATMLRRANFRSFPYHLLFRETEAGPRVLVLRHHRRHPDHGAERQ
ncbi:MAG: type II toxin-antitoxin system RelE/ParE family toxin [Verrucomicrobiota bacterium]